MEWSSERESAQHRVSTQFQDSARLVEHEGECLASGVCLQACHSEGCETRVYEQHAHVCDECFLGMQRRFASDVRLMCVVVVARCSGWVLSDILVWRVYHHGCSSCSQEPPSSVHATARRGDQCDQKVLRFPHLFR